MVMMGILQYAMPIKEAVAVMVTIAVFNTYLWLVHLHFKLQLDITVAAVEVVGLVH